MSSFFLSGFFGLESGQRVNSSKPNNPSSRVYHAVYSSAIQFAPPADASIIPADIRLWSPRSGTLLADNTVAFVVGKAYIPRSTTSYNNTDKALIDALYLMPCPGDPSDPEYEARIPDFPGPLVIALGSVTGGHSTLPNSDITFPLTLSEYVRDDTRQSIIQ